VEWLNEVARLQGGNAPTGGFSESNSAYNLLKLPAAGYRSLEDGILNGQGVVGSYWSSTTNPPFNGTNIQFAGDNAGYSIFQRAYGYSVRCIK
jgi:hypothetical protein